MRLTQTDGYKFSMAEAGAALRQETFYYSHRRGGWHYMPVDPVEYVKSCLPQPTDEDYDYLRAHSYEVGAAYRKAFTQMDSVKVVGVPKGAWFCDREPAFSVTGPSAVVSWLEPLAIALQFQIQIATAIRNDTIGDRVKYATCIAEKDLIEQVFDTLKHPCPSIEVRSGDYYDSVLNRAKNLVKVAKDPNRIFEVGMRAVSCLDQHEIALRAVKAAGILRTSNVYLAQKLDMIPVGTMGHEHVQRYGEDYEAFTAMRDRFPGFLFYLPDTFSTLKSGIPSALRVIAEQPDRDAGIRFDSEHGIRGHYMFTVARAMEMGLKPRLALESGWNQDLTVEFEELRQMIRWPAERQAYGYGGYLVKPDWPTFQRDDVSAVWKICQSGSRATMKFGDEPNSGKSSIPGKPVIWRGNPLFMDFPVSFIAQEDEDWSAQGYYRLSGAVEDKVSRNKERPKTRLSPATEALVTRCVAQREETITRASQNS